MCTTYYYQVVVLDLVRKYGRSTHRTDVCPSHAFLIRRFSSFSIHTAGYRYRYPSTGIPRHCMILDCDLCTGSRAKPALTPNSGILLQIDYEKVTNEITLFSWRRKILRRRMASARRLVALPLPGYWIDIAAPRLAGPLAPPICRCLQFSIACSQRKRISQSCSSGGARCAAVHTAVGGG